MKKTLSILLISLLMFSCSVDVEGAEKVADQYHQNIQNGDLETIYNSQLSTDAKTLTPKKKWMSFFEQVSTQGELDKVEKINGFDSKVSNGITSVILRYKYSYKGDEKDLYEKLILVKEDGDYEISGIAWDIDLAKLPLPSGK